MVALPSLGPMVDHHFAERQPYHAHLGADTGHVHGYRAFHEHLPVGSGANAPMGNEGSVALPNLEVASSAAPAAMPAETDTIRALMDAADGVFAIEGAADSVLGSVYCTPPLRPPRCGALAFVSL